MKRFFLIILLGGFVAGATFVQSEEIRSLFSFSKISVAEGIDVYIKHGSKEQAKVVARSIDLDKVLTEVSNGRLKIHLDGNNHRKVDVDVYVTYKSINALRVSSGASLTTENIVESDGDFDVDVSSAGDIRATIVGCDELNVDVSSAGAAKLEVKADKIEADVSSAGGIEISGKVRMQDIEVSSSGSYKGYDLESKEVDAIVSSGGSIKVNVSEKLDGRASSGGSIRYQGSPKYLDINSSSGGSVRKSP